MSLESQIKEISKGFVRPEEKLDKEHLIKDLHKLSKPRLLELRDRQALILANKGRLSKLPDKGKRIQDFYDKILSALKDQDEIEEAALKFSELNIASRGEKFLTKVEWTQSLKSSQKDLDSDDELEMEEDLDPLKIISQNRQVKTIVHEKVEKSLITDQDLEDIKAFKDESCIKATATEDVVINKSKIEKLMKDVNTKIEIIDDQNSSGCSSAMSGDLDAHTVFLCQKEHIGEVKDKFRPYKTTKTNVHDPEAEVKKNRKVLEITAATPPALRHPGTKLLSLQESIELQIEKEKQNKEAQLKLAELKLLQKTSNSKPKEFVAKDMSDFFKTYRVANEDSESESEASSRGWDSGDEVHDPDAVEEKGGVTFQVNE